MIHMPTSIQPGKSRSSKREAENSPSEFHRLVHEMVNHLTVMNLCCFSRSGSPAATSLSEIADMKAAVEHIAALLDDLAKTTTANPQRRGSVGQAPGTAHVTRIGLLEQRLSPVQTLRSTQLIHPCPA
jgi:hypothetical protein